MRVIKRAVVGGVIAVAVAVSLYFACIGSNMNSTRMTPVTVVSEVLE